MSALPAVAQEAALSQLSPATLEALVVGGDLSRLSPAQCVEYYRARCERAGLDPATQPFQYLVLQGKKTLYASKACTDQLASLHGLRVEIISQTTEDGMRIVQVRAIARDGRATDEIGVLSVAGKKGDELGNALMKCVTKAKRRAVLSLCGLGMLDETEIETIPGARVEPPPQTLSQAAGRAQAKEPPRSVEAEIVQPAKVGEPEPPHVPGEYREQPIPVLDPVDDKSVFYAGVYIQTSVIDLWGAQGKNNWAKHTIEAKNPAINNRTWEWVVEGSPDGEREKWLRTGVGLGIAAQKANKLPTVTSQKCAYALYLMKSRHYEEWKDSKATDEFFASGMKDAAPSTDYDPADVH